MPVDSTTRKSTTPKVIRLFLIVHIVLVCVADVRSQSTQVVGNVTIVSSNSIPPTVGMEGRLEVVLPDAGLTTKTPDRRAPVLLRIAYTRPHGTLTYYDLRYIGREPGRFNLRSYLVATNGAVTTNLPALTVSVSGVLPTPHNGWLEEQSLRSPSFFGGYRIVLVVVCALWIAAFFVILRTGRKTKAIAPATEARSPTFAERIRPLVERAAAGTLSSDEKAWLERLLITYWQQRLGLREVNGEELILRLRKHNEAGALLRALEDWLHRPPGRTSVAIESVLAPYLDSPAEETTEARRD